MSKTKALLSSVVSHKRSFLGNAIISDMKHNLNQYRPLSTSAPTHKRSFIVRRDQTDKHQEIHYIDRTDKHRYFKWGFKPLPTPTILDDKNPQFAVRSPAFKLSNPFGRSSRKSFRERIAEIQRARRDPELERLARSRQLFLPLDKIQNEWCETFGLVEINKLAKFYGIKKDLFQSEDIVLNTWLDVAFDNAKIHRGNLVMASELTSPPKDVLFKSNTDGELHTLIATNLEGHPVDTKELVQWMVCNIKGNDVSKGDTIFEYIPPTPWQGTGYHRLAFTLYKHSEAIVSVPVDDSKTIRARSFDSREFAEKNVLTPVGVAFCQVDWDESVTDTCKVYKDLNGEPLYDWNEYIEPKEKHTLLMRKMNELKYRNM